MYSRFLFLQCRYTLQYTYPYAYYLAKGARKDWFESQQAQLEAEVENLSWKLERAEITDRGVSGCKCNRKLCRPGSDHVQLSGLGAPDGHCGKATCQFGSRLPRTRRLKSTNLPLPLFNATSSNCAHSWLRNSVFKVIVIAV